jgi:hypothetical protein
VTPMALRIIDPSCSLQSAGVIRRTGSSFSGRYKKNSPKLISGFRVLRRYSGIDSSDISSGPTDAIHKNE